MRLVELYESSLQPIDRNNFESIPSYVTGYFRNPTYYNKEKGIDVHIVDMNVDTYIRIAHGILQKQWGKPTISRTITGEEKINHIVSLMKQGVKFPIPYLDLIDNHQDGLHRAESAKILGLTKIPVLVIDRYN